MEIDKIDMIRLTAINPNVFFMLPILCVFLMTYVIWGNAQAIIGVWGLLIIFLLSYHMATFEVRVRTGDQEE